MKKNILTLLASACILYTVWAQPAAVDVKYRRSSLYTLLVQDLSRQYADVIRNAFTAAPIPEKFNDHNLKDREIPGKLLSDNQQQNVTAFLDSMQVAKQMVAKWFNRSPKGYFDMNLIAERGFYDASELDAQKAKQTKRGLALLADAGEELIANTFVLVNDFRYVSKEEVAKVAGGGLRLAAGIMDAAGYGNAAALTNVAAVGVQVAGKGYVVKTTSYLYKLVWNDSVAAVFYNDYWMDANSFSQEKKEAFDKSKAFKLEFVGSQVAWADVQSSIFTKKSEEELVVIATNRSVDAVIAKLERKYEVFRTKTPLYDVNPLGAKIGLKEGLEPGDKYYVLEQRQTPEGKTFYDRIGMIKVEKPVWDNRYAADLEQAELAKKADSTGTATPPAPQLTYTPFSKISGKQFYKGLLIKQK